MTRRILFMALPAFAVSALLVGAAGGGDEVKSGLQVGEFPAPFDVLDITGPNKGTSLCYR